MPRYASKTDDNHMAVIDTLRGMGFSVTSTHDAGNGFPDISIGLHGHSFLAEIKDGDKPPSARKLTPDQVKWHDAWRGQKVILESTEDAWEWGNYIKSEITKCLLAGISFEWRKHGS